MRLGNNGGIIITTFTMVIVLVAGTYVYFAIFDDIKTDDMKTGSQAVVSASSYDGLSGEVSGEITGFASIGDYYMMTFKDDLSDYKFTGVDSTELYFLQYAFDNHESVTVTYTVEDTAKKIQGVTLLSPELPPAPASSEPVKKDDGFPWYVFIAPAVSTSVTVYMLSRNRRHQRRVNAMIREMEERQRTVRIEDRVTGDKPKKKKKKEEEEQEDKTVPLDGRYRIERADALLAEKEKNRRFRRKKKET